MSVNQVLDNHLATVVSMQVTLHVADKATLKFSTLFPDGYNIKINEKSQNTLKKMAYLECGDDQTNYQNLQARCSKA